MARLDWLVEDTGRRLYKFAEIIYRTHIETIIRYYEDISMKELEFKKKKL